MNCEKFKNSIFAWSENDFSSFTTEEFEAHASECVQCSLLKEEIVKTMAIIEQDKHMETDPYAVPRILQKIENRQEAKNWWGFPVNKPALRPVYLGIGILVAILLGVVMGFEESGINKARIANNIDIESVRSELNVPDIMGDDVTEFSNQ
ncbi:MAG: hypothetical protein NTU44_15495 [Bacteroidetes bacterium]|nr:hypothetical protein [Bacteroidota bacterium]